MINMGDVINIDLYEFYIERMGNSTIKHGAQGFYILLRIALACDVVHDFLEPRGKLGVDLWLKYLGANKENFVPYKKNFLAINANRVISDCVHCDLLDKILRDWFEVEGSNRLENIISLFDSEKKAKETIDKIHVILGIQEQNTMDTMVRANKCSNFSVLDLMKAFTYSKPGTKRKSSFTQYNLTVDTTSDKTNLTPFLSELMNRSYKTKNLCLNLSDRIKVINTYATDYDASNENALSKVFKSLELTEKYENTIVFNITCSGYIVFKGYLGDEDGTIRLKIEQYFNRIFTNNLVSSPKGSDSVNAITERMLMSYNAKADREELLNLTILKTMGDFLQIMTHLGLKKSQPDAVNIFISFDIICAKIAGMFDHAVFYEKKFISEQDKLSGGLYTFYTSDQYTNVSKSLERQAEANRLHAHQRKRARNYFGKKTPKVKNLPNKALMTKLKSIGIKITKKRGKRRVYLSRPELIKRATAFRKLQLRAKKLKIRIMYKNRKGKYVYKKAKRLTSDIKKKMKKPVKKSNKKPVKRQMKQKFG